jgi:hypothetical protein
LKNDLGEADATVARQMDNEQKTPKGDLHHSLLMNEWVAMKQAVAKNHDDDGNQEVPLKQPSLELGISGQLLVKSKGVVRKWKTKPSRLFLCGDHYQWDLGDKSFDFEFGISKVEFNPNHPLSFVVLTNPSIGSAPSIQAGAASEEEYLRRQRCMGELNHLLPRFRAACSSIYVTCSTTW